MLASRNMNSVTRKKKEAVVVLKEKILLQGEVKVEVRKETVPQEEAEIALQAEVVIAKTDLFHDTPGRSRRFLL